MSQSVRWWTLRVHKWVGTCLGIIIFIWLLSGVVMILPQGSRPSKDRGTVDYARAALSPAQAIALTASREQDSLLVRRLSLVPVLDRDYYLLEAGNQKSYLLDSESGNPLVITTEIAERIARETAGRHSDPVRVDLVSKPVSGYMGGPLPVYRVAFDDDRGSIVFVSPRDGSARYTDHRARARFLIAGLHTFDQLRLLPFGERIRKPLLYLTSLLGAGLVLTGYYMVFPGRWRR
jgi:hypothetical protein